MKGSFCVIWATLGQFCYSFQTAVKDPKNTVFNKIQCQKAEFYADFKSVGKVANSRTKNFHRKWWETQTGYFPLLLLFIKAFGWKLFGTLLTNFSTDLKSESNSVFLVPLLIKNSPHYTFGNLNLKTYEMAQKDDTLFCKWSWFQFGFHFSVGNLHCLKTVQINAPLLYSVQSQRKREK